MADVAMHGRVLWYELLTTDIEAAERFYANVVGWTVTPFKGGDDAYDMWTRPNGVPMGGVMKIPAGMGFPPHWGMYVGVEPRLEDGIARVEALGGKSLSPLIEVPEVGRMRTMLDAQGAAFSIYEPVSPPTVAEAPPEVGEVSWHELFTNDVDAAMKFYSDLFGWKPTEAMDMGEMGKYQMFGRGWPMGGMMKKPAAMDAAPPFWGFYFRVPDVHAGAERVKAGGGSIMTGPMEVPGGDWVVVCTDPQGANFGLHHRKA
jgi:predicted enzyme related to lactoylglutathione lyase